MNVSAIEFLGEPHQLDARLDPDHFGPAAEQAVLDAIRDAVHPAVRAPRRLLRHQALEAVIAGLVDVEKRDQVAFAERLAVDVDELAAVRCQHADRHVTGDHRKPHARHLAAPDVHVGAAYLGVRGGEQRRARRQRRRRKLHHPRIGVRCIEHRRADGVTLQRHLHSRRQNARPAPSAFQCISRLPRRVAISSSAAAGPELPAA